MVLEFVLLLGCDSQAWEVFYFEVTIFFGIFGCLFFAFSCGSGGVLEFVVLVWWVLFLGAYIVVYVELYDFCFGRGMLMLFVCFLDVGVW